MKHLLCVGLALGLCAFVLPSQANAKRSPKDIRKVMAKKRGTLVKCYKAYWKREQGEEVKVKAKMQIMATGKVSKVTIQTPDEDMAGDAKLRGCLVKKIKAFKFGKSKDGKSQTVSWPIRFRPGYDAG